VIRRPHHHRSGEHQDDEKLPGPTYFLVNALWANWICCSIAFHFRLVAAEVAILEIRFGVCQSVAPVSDRPPRPFRTPSNLPRSSAAWFLRRRSWHQRPGGVLGTESVQIATSWLKTAMTYFNCGKRVRRAGQIERTDIQHALTSRHMRLLPKRTSEPFWLSRR